MRKLVVLFALSLTTATAWAQTDKALPVTKLPGEESLSTRERAERDFLMPVRRKRAAELSKPTASAEQLTTAAPENDAIAHYNEAAADPRTEEVTAIAHETATRSRAARHAAWLAARRTHLRDASALRRSTKSSKASRTKVAKHSKATKHHEASKASSHRSTRATAHKTKKATATKTKHHAAAKKVKAKNKPAPKHKHRR